jgi:hypothetical protein
MKLHVLLGILLILLIASCGGEGSSQTGILSGGIGLGSLIAVLASWERNKSVFWAILHCLFGWLYVIYYVITR